MLNQWGYNLLYLFINLFHYPLLILIWSSSYRPLLPTVVLRISSHASISAEKQGEQQQRRSGSANIFHLRKWWCWIFKEIGRQRSPAAGICKSKSSHLLYSAYLISPELNKCSFALPDRFVNVKEEERWWWWSRRRHSTRIILINGRDRCWTFYWNYDYW